MCVCIWGGGVPRHKDLCEEVWAFLSVVDSLPLSRGTQELNAGHQVWLQAPSPTESQPHVFCFFFSEWQNFFSLITLRPFLNSTFSGDTTHGYTSSSLHIPKEMRDSERHPEVLEFASYWSWTILRLATSSARCRSSCGPPEGWVCVRTLQ